MKNKKLRLFLFNLTSRHVFTQLVTQFMKRVYRRFKKNRLR